MTTNIPKCDECNRKAKVLMRIGANPDDWVYASCDRCLEYLCARHAEADEDGQVVCDTCYEQECILKPRGQ